jgi:hypothetical protein
MVVLESSVKRGCRVRRVGAAVLTAIAFTGVPVVAQLVSAPGIKAAYLFNFAQFVEWPADVVPAAAPLGVCIVNDAAVATALEQTIKGRTVGGRAVTVIRLATGATLPACHVIYLTGPDQKYLADVIGALNGRLVLTVSDASRFARTGGMVELYLEGGRMKIAVNVDALQRGKVRLSSRVLQLATIVRDAPSQ